MWEGRTEDGVCGRLPLATAGRRRAALALELFKDRRGYCGRDFELRACTRKGRVRRRKGEEEGRKRRFGGGMEGRCEREKARKSRDTYTKDARREKNILRK
jgi:hypothetical protein